MRSRCGSRVCAQVPGGRRVFEVFPVLAVLAANLDGDVDEDDVDDEPDAAERHGETEGLLEGFVGCEQHAGSLATQRAPVS